MMTEKRSAFKWWMLVLLAVGTTVKSQGQETYLENAANEFIIGFSVNYNVSVILPSLLLFVTTPETNPVTFTVTANGFNFTGTAFNNSSTEVSIPSTFQVESNSERNKGIYVKAEGESKIVVYGLSYHMHTSDAFLALPCSNLAVEEYEYYAMTYSGSNLPSDVLIVGCEDNTLVTTPSNAITLNRLETYLIQSSDSTGMRVTSTKPVSFFSNQRCTNVPRNHYFCDHLTEQIPPTSTWGTSFYAASLLGRNSGELFRIITAKNYTTVTVNCTTFSQVQVYNLSIAGNWQEFQIHPLSFCTIESSSPILVTQFSLGRTLDNITGDPFMMMIPPVEQYSNNYVLNALSDFSTNYITIYVATEYYQPNRIFVDDTSQVVSSWTSVYCSNSLLCGYITRVSLTAGEHSVYHQDPHARIGVSAYGFSPQNSYGYPGGLKLTLFPPLNVTLTGSGGTLREGQNHVLTCEASGGGSMAYIYMWLRNGIVVSGQTSSTYSFFSLRVDDSGQYNCRVSLGSVNMISGTITITVLYAVPDPPRNLRATMHTATSITITWTETTTTNIDRYEVTYSYTVRRCSAPAGPTTTNTLTSSSRSHTLMNLNEDSTYTITVRNINGAASNMATITANTATAVPSAGPSSVTPTTVGTTSITIEWSELDCTDRNRVITGYKIRYGPTSTTPSQRQIATISNPGRRMFTVDREFITHSYDFEVAAINVDGTGPYSTPLTVDTAVPTGLGFYLNGMTYSNNSVLTITDIGEGDMSLYCITERSECCRSSDGGERGDWFLPGQDSAVEGTSTGDFSRRREPRAVVLDRRNNAIVPIGLYRCEVPDAGNTIQSLYIGVYTNDRGRPSVSLVSYSHTSQSLNCTSSGGPATNVTWRKDNIIIPLTSSTYQQSQTVANEVTSTYHNLLFITSSSVEDHRGSFSCTIGNDRGSSENYLLVINKIEISGNQSIYQLGSSHRITCSSDLTVQSIQWLDTSDNGEILTSNTGEQQLVLEIDDITAAINNTMYTCEVTLTLQTTLVMETIHLVVSNANFPRHPKSVIVTATTPTGVYIQWMLTEPFNATRPETFVVLYGTTQNGLTRTSTSMVIATATSQTYSIQLNSLDIGTQYYFQVQSRNRFGSIVSNVMDFTTDDTMSGPVMDLKTYSPDNSTLVISWRPPSTPNGNIISYTVRIENLRDGTTLRDIADLNAVTTSLTEDGLIPGVPYRVSFIAVNRAGQGNITVLTNFTKELEPNHPPKDVKVDRIHPTVMVVTWIPLTLPEARGFITSYTVFYSPQVSRGKRQEHHTMQKAVSGNVNQTTINGLDPNTAYDVQMSANTTAGASALSEVISAQVPSDTGGLSIVVIVVALVVVLALILIIILLVLLVLKMRWTVRTRNTESVEFQTHNIDDQSGIYEVIDEEWKEEIFSEIKSPSSTNKVNNQSKVEELTMTQCPAYAPVTSLTINCRR